jgi:hypothetical protein
MAGATARRSAYTSHFSSMNKSKSLSTILALDLHPGRFGYVVLEDSTELVDWGVRRNYRGTKPWRTALIQKKFSSLLNQWEPTLVLLNEVPRFSPQIRRIVTLIRKEARYRKLPVRVVDKQGVKSAFGLGQQITKHETACLMAEQIPDLHWELPPKRKIWESEHYRMSIFTAAALAMAISVDKLDDLFCSTKHTCL